MNGYTKESWVKLLCLLGGLNSLRARGGREELSRCSDLQFCVAYIQALRQTSGTYLAAQCSASNSKFLVYAKIFKLKIAPIDRGAHWNRLALNIVAVCIPNMYIFFFPSTVVKEGNFAEANWLCAPNTERTCHALGSHRAAMNNILALLVAVSTLYSVVLSTVFLFSRDIFWPDVLVMPITCIVYFARGVASVLDSVPAKLRRPVVNVGFCYHIDINKASPYTIHFLCLAQLAIHVRIGYSVSIANHARLCAAVEEKFLEINQVAINDYQVILKFLLCVSRASPQLCGVQGVQQKIASYVNTSFCLTRRLGAQVASHTIQP